MRDKPTVILGGGPAGLTAGYLLAKKGLPVVVLEAEDQVGGIAKTAVRDGYRFDLGGHRFFTKVKEVDDLWHEIMREDFLKRPRMSRIYWTPQVPRLPAARPGRDQEARPGRPDQGVPLLPVGEDQAEGQGGHVRAVGREPLRPLALQRVLQVLHREGLGRADVRDPRRLGGSAHQGPVVLQRRQVGVLRQQGRQDQVAHLGVQLPPLRPRPDVGDDDRRHPQAGRPGAARAQGDQARLRGRALRARARGRDGVRAVGRDLVAAAAQRRRDREPAPAARGRGRRARACATATS